MRVMFVYKYLTLGGVEAVLRARLVGLAAFGVEAQAWFLSNGDGQVMFDGVQSAVHIGDPLSLRRYLSGTQVDVISVIDTEEVFPAIAGIRNGPAVVVEIHSPYRENRVYLNWVRHLGVRAFFVPSYFQAGIVRRSAGRLAPVCVIRNCLDETFVLQEMTSAPIDGPPIIAWVGRLDKVKNWELGIEITGILKRSGVGAETWIIGRDQDPKVPEWYLSKAAREDVLERVHWLKGMPHNRVARFFDMVRATGGAYLSTSRSESFGMTVAEAMARQCGVVVPDIGAFKELVEDGVDGCLYKNGSAQAAAQKLVELLNDPERRANIGVEARSSSLKKSAPKVALAALAEALRNTVSDQLEGHL